ncbi:mitochondrial large ribosomal subunit [Grosmannia clavigera kw1407]|uniref:Mitochondrial large ribosomal subunit n=1 Tax=Grosmannia clavigera (strain kw1407 / UAMH 11150) TaxID=655863 RepID=F0XHQ9_GROCL|nr:mitochondrial large ribosomal subunit [Grosmannia clavigera kw1407]EFX03135.1 mitochondrial large ribosomal subunit [Grosmannia clavigera kw1407]
MSLTMSSRRVLATASSGFRPATATSTTAAAVLVLRPLHTTAARAVDWGRLFGRRKKKPAAAATGDVADGLAGDLARSRTRQALKDRMTNPQLDASPFLSEMEESAGPAADVQADKTPASSRATTARNDLGTSLVPEHLQRALDPDPRSRVRWERKMVLRHVSRLLDPAGAETRDERLARTERQLLHKSAPLATSTKKLTFLARQIAGKTLEDALVQMRFSKKKMARDVLWHLEEARDTAIVERGMGLGLVNADVSTTAPASTALKIQTKDGRWLAITDPSRIYVDQAWVGKGVWRAATPDYRARGRRFLKWSPSSFLSVVLKEEKTRIRLHDERVAKQAKKAPWVHLPNRPVTAQRPYYSW